MRQLILLLKQIQRIRFLHQCGVKDWQLAKMFKLDRSTVDAILYPTARAQDEE